MIVNANTCGSQTGSVEERVYSDKEVYSNEEVSHRITKTKTEKQRLLR